MNDTHPKIEQKRLEMLRILTPEQRNYLTQKFLNSIIELSRDQFQSRFGALGLQRWLEVHYGERLARGALGEKYQESTNQGESFVRLTQGEHVSNQ
jgi:hypothetical protein